jgi:transposase
MKIIEKNKARELRKQGKSIIEIAKTLKVAKSSVSLWVRDLPQPEQFTKEFKLERKKIRKERIKVERIKLKEEKRKKREEEIKRRYNQHPLNRILHSDGRWFIKAPKGYKGKVYRSGYILEYRYVMEKKLGRYLSNEEIVHHKDGNKMNNHPDNLEVFTRSTHAKYHRSFDSPEYVKVVCNECGKSFDKEKRIFKYREKKNSLNFYCSKTCLYKKLKKNNRSS